MLLGYGHSENVLLKKMLCDLGVVGSLFFGGVVTLGVLCA